MSDLIKFASFLDDFFRETEEKQEGPNETVSLIGQEIQAVFTYTDVIEDWVDYSHSFIVLEERTIDIPISGAGYINRKIHPHAKPLDGMKEKLITGKRIVDIIDQFDKADPSEARTSIIILSNGYAIWEQPVAPHGSGEAGLFIYDSNEFKAYKETHDYIFNSLINESHVQ